MKEPTSNEPTSAEPTSANGYSFRNPWDKSQKIIAFLEWRQRDNIVVSVRILTYDKDYKLISKKTYPSMYRLSCEQPIISTTLMFELAKHK